MAEGWRWVGWIGGESDILRWRQEGGERRRRCDLSEVDNLLLSDFLLSFLLSNETIYALYCVSIMPNCTIIRNVWACLSNGAQGR